MTYPVSTITITVVGADADFHQDIHDALDNLVRYGLREEPGVSYAMYEIDTRTLSAEELLDEIEDVEPELVLGDEDLDRLFPLTDSDG